VVEEAVEDVRNVEDGPKRDMGRLAASGESPAKRWTPLADVAMGKETPRKALRIGRSGAGATRTL
jgi:hypothetical protein